MSVEIKLNNRNSTPLPIIIGTLLLGITSPAASYALVQGVSYHLHVTHDMTPAIFFLLLAVMWPAAWISAMFLGALNPLFGQTEISISEKCIAVRKYLFRCCWKKLEFENDENTVVSLSSHTEQSPTHSSANQMGEGITTCTVYRLAIRNGKRLCNLHESYNEDDERSILNDIHQAIQATRASQ